MNATNINSPSRRLWIIALLALAGCVGLFVSTRMPARPVFSFKNRILTIKTARYEAVWQNGCMVQLATLHNGIQRLTVAPDTMKTSWLPNGLGSFDQNEKAGNTQHLALWSHNLKSGAPSFPAQHPACEQSAVTCEDIKGGVRLTYTGLQGDATAKLIQDLVVEEETGDLVIRQKAGSDNHGVFGIGFSLLNLNPDIEFALPYFSGVRIGGKNDNRVAGWAWPGFWSAGLIVAEIPGGGSFFVFADDPKLGPKYLKMYSTADVQGLGFEACGQHPYADKREVEICTWRFNTFAGSWMEPAERYKQWLAKAYGCKPRRERSPDWFNKISLYWPSGLNVSEMEILAKKLDPRHILIADYGWAKGFNHNAPFYQPNGEGLKETAAKMHALGYHYGVYVSHKLIDRHAYPELPAKYRGRMAFDGLTQDSAILDDIRDAEKEIVEAAKEKKGGYLIGIHPGSDDWIEFYSDLMVEFHDKYGMDVFYQDCAGSNLGSSGLIDGRSIHEGTVACEKRIREKLPQVATIGEHWSEVIVAAGMELGSGSFAAWFNPAHHKWLGDRAHPLLGYIFGEYTGLVMYKTPLLSAEQFHRDQNFLEVTGSIPTWRAAATADTGEARLVILRARLFADGFAPYYPKAGWEKDAVAYMRDAQGRIAKYLRRDGSTFCYKEIAGKDKLYYARVTGRGALPMPESVHIDGWFAYDERGPIGLAPERWYAVFPGAPENLALTIAKLPENIRINGARVAASYFLADWGGAGTGTVDVISNVRLLGQTAPGKSRHAIVAPGSLLLAFKEAPKANPGEVLPLQDWSLLEIVNGLVAGKADWWKTPRDWKLGDDTCRGFGVAPPSGGPGSEISIDGYLRVPNDKRAALAFSMGRLGGAGDGVHFVVRVNGKEVWRRFSEAGKRGWTPAVVPLTSYAGQNIVLSLAVDCGPSRFNGSNDQSIWGDPKLILREPEAARIN